MRNLKKMVDFVNRNKTKHLEAFLEPDSSKLLEFYHALAEDRFPSEMAAEKYFFGDTKNPHSNFTRLKRQLFDRLSDLILLIDFSTSPYQDPARGYSYCAKVGAVINIWNYMTANPDQVVKLAEKSLRVALHFGFTDHIINCARFCYMSYMSKRSHYEKCKYYRDLLSHHIKTLETELFLEQEHLEYRRIMLGTRKKISQKIVDNAQRSAEKIKILLKEHASFRLDFYSLMFTVMVLESNAEYDKVIDFIYDTIKRLHQGQSKLTNTGIGFAYSVGLMYLTKTGRYAEAREMYEAFAERLIVGSGNWGNFLGLYFTLCAHTEHYNECQRLTVDVLTHPNYRRFSDTSRSRWHIREAYIHYLAELGFVRLSPEMPPFSMKRFRRNVAPVRRDAGGHSLGILIIEILLLACSSKGQDELVERMESFQIYIRRHLRGDYTFRGRYFLKMLVEMIKAGFHPVRTQAYVKAKGLKKKLSSIPYEEAKQSEDLEIIPFERLWDMAMESIS